MKELGDRITEARKAKGLNQRRAARLVGISPPQYNAIENGRSRSSVPTLRIIAEVVGLPRSELLRLAGYEDDAALDQVNEMRAAEQASDQAPRPQTLAELLHRAAELAEEQARQAQGETPDQSPQAAEEQPPRHRAGPRGTRRTGTQGTRSR